MVGKKQLLTKDIYFYRTYLSSWSSVMCRVYCEYQFLVLSEETCIVTRLGPWRTSGRFRWSHIAYDCTFSRLYPSRKRNTSWTRRNRWKMAEDSLPSWLAHSRHVTSLGPSPIVIEVGGRGLRLILSHLYHFLWRRWSSCLWQLELSWLWRMGRLIVISWPDVSVIGPFSDNGRGSNGDTDLHCVILK